MHEAGDLRRTGAPCTEYISSSCDSASRMYCIICRCGGDGEWEEKKPSSSFQTIVNPLNRIFASPSSLFHRVISHFGLSEGERYVPDPQPAIDDDDDDCDGRSDFPSTRQRGGPTERGWSDQVREIKMDDYLFRHFVDECRVVYEATGYVEIFNYSVSWRPLF